MEFHVYMIITKKNNRYFSYVGYSKNIEKRLSLHNSSKGAKFTKGNYWKIIYKKKYNSKSEAMKAEYNLKKNNIYRSKLKKKFINDKNINITSL
tara:strand:+ start:170 stop:451 length:282 start_codon:yes stop_codon:yes gene_type:complete